MKTIFTKLRLLFSNNTIIKKTLAAMKIKDLKLGQKVLVGNVVTATYKGINKVKMKIGKLDRHVFQNDEDCRDRRTYSLDDGHKTLKSEGMVLIKN